MTDDLVVVSGIPLRIGLLVLPMASHYSLPGDQHVVEIALMALDILAGAVVFEIPHKPNTRLSLRMGIHSGPAMAVVAGSDIPSYCVMSEVTNVARALEQQGEGMRIHIRCLASCPLTSLYPSTARQARSCWTRLAAFGASVGAS
jgi:class 3 adenylate cyclase